MVLLMLSRVRFLCFTPLYLLIDEDGEINDKLIDLGPIATMQDTRKLRVMYDTVETNVRSLKTMGVAAECYEQVLTPMILKKSTQRAEINNN